MSGWFAMKRGLHDHPIFHKQPLRVAAWSWMVATAAYKDTRQDANGKTVVVKRGQLLTSYRQMSDATGVSIKALRILIARLEGENAIGTDKGTGRLLITIRNYDKYQSAPADEGTGKGTGRAQEGHTKETREQDTTLEAKASNGADAPSVVEISVVSSAVWAAGRQYLSSRGVPNPGAMIGKWLKTHPPIAILGAIEAAQSSGTQDPIPYITAALAGPAQFVPQFDLSKFEASQ